MNVIFTCILLSSAVILSGATDLTYIGLLPFDELKPPTILKPKL